MRFVVGGEEFEFSREAVERSLKGVPPEPFQKYVVELLGTVYPPKQVFAIMSGRDRSSFTTQEAQRVLTRLGFVCREAGRTTDGVPAWVAVVADDLPTDPAAPLARDAAVENALATVQLAIAELQRRLAALEIAQSPVAK